MTWIPIKEVVISEPEYNKGVSLTTGEGADISDYFVSLSPFNMPSRMEVTLNPDTKYCSVIFGYANTEPAARELIHDKLKVQIGQHSKKLLALQFPCDSLGASTSPPQLPATLANMLSGHQDGSQEFVFAQTAKIANALLATNWKLLRSQLLKAQVNESRSGAQSG